MKNNTLPIIIVAAVVLVGGFFVFNSGNGNVPSPQNNGSDSALIAPEGSIPPSSTDIFPLEDVTGGEEFVGVSTEGLANGNLTISVFDGEEVIFDSVFTGLPELPPGYFYEGWIVNRDVPPAEGVVSTGPLFFEDELSEPDVNVFGNLYRTMEDVSGFTLFTVTVEPDDNDPAPNPIHVVEGPMDLAGLVASAQGPGVYADFDQSLLANADNGPTVLFFKAAWCTTCNALDRDIEANLDSLPGNVSILKVDYDKETELKKKYGVRIQHTLVQVDSAGNEINQWNGSLKLNQILSQIT